MIHIAPVGDIIEHDQNTHMCQCNPVVDFENNLVVHYAMDGRAQLNNEAIKKILSS